MTRLRFLWLFISVAPAALIVCAAMRAAPVSRLIAAVFSLELSQSDPNLQLDENDVLLGLGQL